MKKSRKSESDGNELDAHTWKHPATIYRGRELIAGLAISRNGMWILMRTSTRIMTRIVKMMMLLANDAGWPGDSLIWLVQI